jgi:hypothetical protein
MTSKPPTRHDESEAPFDDLIGSSLGHMLDAHVPRRKVTHFNDLEEMQGAFDDDVTVASTTIRETLKRAYAKKK